MKVTFNDVYIDGNPMADDAILEVGKVYSVVAHIRVGQGRPSAQWAEDGVE